MVSVRVAKQSSLSETVPICKHFRTVMKINISAWFCLCWWAPRETKQILICCRLLKLLHLFSVLLRFKAPSEKDRAFCFFLYPPMALGVYNMCLINPMDQIHRYAVFEEFQKSNKRSEEASPSNSTYGLICFLAHVRLPCLAQCLALGLPYPRHIINANWMQQRRGINMEIESTALIFRLAFRFTSLFSSNVEKHFESLILILHIYKIGKHIVCQIHRATVEIK